MSRRRLKHPTLLRVIIIMMFLFGLHMVMRARDFSFVLLGAPALLTVHYAIPTVFGWAIIIMFTLLPVLLIAGYAWSTTGFSIVIENTYGLGTMFAIALIIVIVLALLLVYATQVAGKEQ